MQIARQRQTFWGHAKAASCKPRLTAQASPTIGASTLSHRDTPGRDSTLLR